MGESTHLIRWVRLRALSLWRKLSLSFLVPKRARRLSLELAQGGAHPLKEETRQWSLARDWPDPTLAKWALEIFLAPCTGPIPLQVH